MGSLYGDRVNDRALEAAERIAEVARSMANLNPLTLALAWVRERPGVTAPILGPRTEEQLETFLKTLDHRLSAEVERALDEIVPPGQWVADFQNNSGCR